MHSHPDQHSAKISVLGPMLHALHGPRRPDQARMEPRVADDVNMALSFGPRDVLETMLVGQMIMVNQAIGDAVGGLLGAATTPVKIRGQSALATLIRTMQGHVDRFETIRRRPLAFVSPDLVPHAVTPDQHAAAPAVPEATLSQAPAAPVAEPPAPPDIIGGYRRPEAPESWLDEPFAQWLLETPADEAAAAAEIASAAEASPDEEPAGTLATEMDATTENNASGKDPGFVRRSELYVPLEIAGGLTARPGHEPAIVIATQPVTTAPES